MIRLLKLISRGYERITSKPLIHLSLTALRGSSLHDIIISRDNLFHNLFNLERKSKQYLLLKHTEPPHNRNKIQNKLNYRDSLNGP